MIGLIQRVTEANVIIAETEVAQINAGLLLLLGVEKEDTPAKAERLLKRVLNYRIFSDAQGRMNRSLHETGGQLLVVPQFTLAADTRKGNRPSFSGGADPVLGETLFNYFCDLVQAETGTLHCGRFGADMQVGLVNDGPVTFWLNF